MDWNNGILSAPLGSGKTDAKGVYDIWLKAGPGGVFAMSDGEGILGYITWPENKLFAEISIARKPF